MADNFYDDGQAHAGEPIESDASVHLPPPAVAQQHALMPHVDGQLFIADEAVDLHSHPAPLLPTTSHDYPPPPIGWAPPALDVLPPPSYPLPSEPYPFPVEHAAALEASFYPDAVVSPAAIQPPVPEPVSEKVYEPFLPTHFRLPEHCPRGFVRVYYSIDPTRGSIDVYPKRFSQKINDAINESRGKSGGSIYLGKQFFDATVHWDVTEATRCIGSGPQLYQTTPGCNVGGSYKSSGMRDVWVKDFEVCGSRELCHEVQRVNYEWTGLITERLPEDDPTQFMATTVVPDEHFVVDDGEELLPRWQWCKRTNETLDLVPWEERTTGRASIFNVLEKEWGFYTDEVDQQIQAAHAAEEPHVDVVLCSRQYRIMFQKGSIYAKQVDPIMRKERVARLVYMKPSAVQQRMVGESCTLSDDEVCPICLLQFRDTPTIQIFALPCGHQFHGMCIQNEADKNHKCPYCRC
jgi:hypothetical protein